MIKVRCKNMFCNASDIEINDIWENFDKYQDMVCSVCGYVGMMPSHHVLKTKTIVEQILLFSDKFLFRDLFKKINFEKLPKSMMVQKICNMEVEEGNEK